MLLCSAGSRRQTQTFREDSFPSRTDLDRDAGLARLLTVPQQGVRAAAGEVEVEAVEGLKVVLTPRPARHLPLKAGVRNCRGGTSRRSSSHFSSAYKTVHSCQAKHAF